MTAPSQPLRVLLVDDHPLVREGVRAFLSRQPDLAVVGEASNAAEALEQLTLEPDLVLLDLVLGEERALDLVPLVRARAPRCRILVLTSFGDEHLCIPALRSGAHGLVLKTIHPAALVAAIRAVARGESVLEPTLARRLVELARDRLDSEETALHRLTARERQILEHIAEGRKNEAIAEELGLSEKTVKGHVTAILGKLDVDDRTQAAVFLWRRRR